MHRLSNSDSWVGTQSRKEYCAQFTYGSLQILIVNLETWQFCYYDLVYKSLNTYSNQSYNIIVATHAYLASPNGDFHNDLSYNGTWETSFGPLKVIQMYF
jgi:hypothetical protein